MAGLSLDHHRTRQVTEDLVRESDFVFAMSSEHVIRLRRLFGREADRAQILDESGADVSDPFGGPVEDYVGCFRRLDSLIRARIPQILASAPPPAERKKS